MSLRNVKFQLARSGFSWLVRVSAGLFGFQLARSGFSWLVRVSAGLFGFQLARSGFSWLVRVSAGSLLCLAPLVVVHSFTDGIIPVQLAIACTHACPTFVVLRQIKAWDMSYLH